MNSSHGTAALNQPPAGSAAPPPTTIRRKVLSGFFLVSIALPLRGADPENRILAPSLGRPQIVAPGENIDVIWCAAAPAAAPTATLRHAVERSLVLELAPASDPRPGPHGAMSLRTPESALEGVYDLELKVGDKTLCAAHAVALRRERARLRVVSLSNMNIGDAMALTPPAALVDEINLIAPDVVIATGDYLDATHPAPEEGWRRLGEFFARFDAPLLLACGDHDDLRHYGEWIAPSPIGATRIGRRQFLTLYDHPAAPIGHDSEQVRWVEQLLSREDAELRFIISHDEFPGLLAHWRDAGTLAERVANGRIGAWFTGGHTDWNGREYTSIFKAAGPLLYVRTAQSSAALRDGSSGRASYRWFDLIGDQVTFPNGDAADALPPSIETGLLRVSRHELVDGVARFAIQNAHPFPIEGLMLKARLPLGGEPAWAIGAEIEREAIVGDFRLLWLRCGVPARGAVGVQAGVGPAPLERSLLVRFQAPPFIPFRRGQASGAIDYLRAELSEPVVAEITNAGPRSIETAAMARLDGDLVGLSLLGSQAPAAARAALRLAAGETLALQVDLSAVRVRAGRQQLQLLLGDPRWPQAFTWSFEASLKD